MSDRLQIDPRDNVAVCLTGEGEIPAGHKVALTDIPKDAFVVKYGAVIGRATRDIRTGEWVHTHNMRSHLDEAVSYSYTYQADEFPASAGTFLGYRRPWGRAGIRNEIYIVPTVGCVNAVCKQLEKQAQPLIRGSIDGIFALPHQFGCSQLGEDQENIAHLLAAIAKNPNATAVLIVGLGCENNGLDGIRALLADSGRGDSLAFLNCQDVEDEIACGMEILARFADMAAPLKREAVSLSELCLGLKCGGSDGYSGITANPLVGKISDRLVSLGGSAVLTEVPEMFGAEQRLMDRCASADVFARYRDMIVNFKKFYTDQGFPVYENPSPGNKKGGITTLEEKSLGCVQKAGHTKIVDVLAYGDSVSLPGVSVLNAPGNDLVAATALAAAGCQMVLFTTGRGTPFSTFVPTVKISSNNRIAALKDHWIDFNAYGMDEDGLFRLILALANGDVRTKSEANREIAFYKTGVTL